ncbi:MAG TPA: hypothetical protein VM098_02700 [Phycisphaerae bacterium]|nr:hypothetical protein [Phycisphaerae bacterium]
MSDSHATATAGVCAEQSRPARPTGLLFAVGRLVGFSLFAGLATTIFAGIILLPPYASYVQARYERDCLAAEVADLAALVATKDRFIAAMPHDRVFAKTLMMSHARITPPDEVVLTDPKAQPVAPSESVYAKRHPRPAQPEGPLLQMAGKIERPAVRRGLCVLAALSLAMALFLFSSPKKYRRRAPRPAG